MLETLQKYALRFAGARKILLILVFAAAILLGLVLLLSGSHEQDMLMIPAILFFIWVTMAFSCINLFAHVPEPVQGSIGFVRRLLVAFKRGFYYLFALIMIGISIALLVTTWQLTMVWIYMYVL